MSPAPRSLTKGVMVNFLSPHPYIFWLTVGGPMTTRAWAETPWAAAGIYRSVLRHAHRRQARSWPFWLQGLENFLRGGSYLYTMKILGGLLCILGLMLARDGIRLVGLI